MAELVQEAMENMIQEVEEMERVGILENYEVKELLKKRKQFEYKINKQKNKKKEDYLSYIQYERNLINLIEIRRKKVGYHHKAEVIEYSIFKRINKLFSISTYRWKSDVKLWLSHIDWLKQVNWVNVLSIVYMRALQIHNSDPKLWIAAAKYEFERGDVDTGRKILLRGLRFHPESKLIHREYIKFELLYVQKLHKRREVLKIKKKEETNEDDNETRQEEDKTEEDGDVNMEKADIEDEKKDSGEEEENEVEDSDAENDEEINEEEVNEVEDSDAGNDEEMNEEEVNEVEDSDAGNDEEMNEEEVNEEEGSDAENDEEMNEASGEEVNEGEVSEKENEASGEENEASQEENEDSEEENIDSGEENADSEEENEASQEENEDSDEENNAAGEEENADSEEEIEASQEENEDSEKENNAAGEEENADSEEDNKASGEENDNSDKEEEDAVSGEEENVASEEDKEASVEENEAPEEEENKGSEEEENVESGEEEENEVSGEKDEASEEEENADSGEEEENAESGDKSEKEPAENDSVRKAESKISVMESKQAMDETHSVEDKILNCDLVNLVVKSALEAVEEPEFAVSLLMTARKFPFSTGVQEYIIQILKDTFPEHPVTVDTLARMELEKDGKAIEVIKKCVGVYTAAISTAPSTQLLHLATTTIKELGTKVRNCDVLLVNSLLELMGLGHESGHLGLEEYEFYLQLINIENSSEFEEVLEHVLIKFPTHILFWNIKLQESHQVEEILKTMNAAHKALKDQQDLSRLWQRFMELMTKLGKSEEAYAYLEEKAGQMNLAFLRVLYLDRAYEKGIQKAREVYKRFQQQPPFNSDLHKNILTFELEQRKVDKINVRKVYETYTSQFGKENIEVWLDWISWETRFGHVMEVPNIICRAESVLKPELVNKFNILREIS